MHAFWARSISSVKLCILMDHPVGSLVASSLPWYEQGLSSLCFVKLTLKHLCSTYQQPWLRLGRSSFWTDVILNECRPVLLLLDAPLVHQVLVFFKLPLGQVVWLCPCSLELFPFRFLKHESRTMSASHLLQWHILHSLIGLLKLLALTLYEFYPPPFEVWMLEGLWGRTKCIT